MFFAQYSHRLKQIPTRFEFLQLLVPRLSVCSKIPPCIYVCANLPPDSCIPTLMIDKSDPSKKISPPKEMSLRVQTLPSLQQTRVDRHSNPSRSRIVPHPSTLIPHSSSVFSRPSSLVLRPSSPYIVNLNVAPSPGSLSTQILPPWRSTIRWQIARPIPVPG
jgi:hypothetical protein